jgi:hypothetical protein
MNFAVLKGGIVKSKNYCPNPIIRNGIPSYADAILNPKCVNTPAYNQWWEEQVYYCKNGYTTGGIWVPGRYYKFVNFDTFRGIAGDNIRAELHDFQLDYAYLIEQSRKEHFNIIVPKARRKTVTTMNICMVVDYGFRFELNYKAAVVAGKQEFADVFMDEWKYIDSKACNEFRIKKLKGYDKDDTVAGWLQENTSGEKIESGTRNTIYTRTVFHDPNILKGKFCHDIILEESGENENLIEVINASKANLMDGSIQVGTFHIYGTGGNMNKGSKGFKKIYYDTKKSNKFNCKALFIPATVFLKPYVSGSTDVNGVPNEIVPNLLHMKPYERVGWSDEIAADAFIKAEKERLLNSSDLEEYFKFCQNYPTTEEEVFRKTASNNFPIIQLNAQGHKLLSEENKYEKFRLFYKKDAQGNTLIPYEVYAEKASADTPEEDCVLIHNNGHPQRGYRWLDVGGIDSYDQDQSKTSSSLGAMVVFRRRHNIPNVPEWLPVALIRNRPKRKEMFYEQCMMLAIYYDLVDGVLGDRANGVILNHFKEMGCERFLSYSPKKFESPNTKQQEQQYWISINNYSKPKMVGLLQTFFFLHTEKIEFINIIEEALNYDEHEIGSDNDTIDALGIALMKALDMDIVATDESELMKNSPFDYPDWGTDNQGNLFDKTSKNVGRKDPKEDDFSYFARNVLAVGVNEEKENNSQGAFDL